MIGNGCTGTQAGPCSPERSVYTYQELASQGFVSAATQRDVELACAESQGFTNASLPCQVPPLPVSPSRRCGLWVEPR